MKTHCIHGHQLTDNIIIWQPDRGKGGNLVKYPICKTCQRAREKECHKRRRLLNPQIHEREKEYACKIGGPKQRERMKDAEYRAKYNAYQRAYYNAHKKSN